MRIFGGGLRFGRSGVFAVSLAGDGVDKASDLDVLGRLRIALRSCASPRLFEGIGIAPEPVAENVGFLVRDEEAGVENDIIVDSIYNSGHDAALPMAE